MANGKEIPIKITTSADTKGAEAATGAITNVKREADRAAKSLPALSDAQQSSAVKSELQAEKFRILTSEQNRLTSSSFNLRNGLSNVGYQIQDYAVQTQMGVSASRAFAQQGPQLLSALGPWGIALGTVVALGAPLLEQLGAQKDAMDDVAGAVNDATRETIEMQRAEAETANLRAEAEERNKAYAESIQRITDEGFDYLGVLRQEIELLREKQGLENTVEEARGQRRIEEAGDDPVKQEQVRNQVRKEAQDREIRQLEEEIEKRRDLMNRAIEREKAIQIRGGNESGSFATRAEEAAARALQAEQEKKIRDAEAASLRDAAGKQRGPQRGQSNREAAAAEDAAREAGSTARAARAEEADLRRQAKEAADKAAKEATAAFDEANKLFQEINRLGREAEAKREVFTQRDASGVIREERVAKQEDEKRRKEQEREEEKRRREREREEDARRKIEEAGPSIGRDAADAARGLGAREGITRGLERLGLQIGRKGDAVGDGLALDQILAMVEKLVAAAEAREAKTQQVDPNAEKLRQLDRRITQLQGQFKTSRDGR